jgi:hypothetical protein
LKTAWRQSVNYIKKLRKLSIVFRLLDWKIIAYMVLPIYWAIIILGTLAEALGPRSSKLIYMYPGSRIMELDACGLTLEPLCLGLEACGLLLQELGA